MSTPADTPKKPGAASRLRYRLKSMLDRPNSTSAGRTIHVIINPAAGKDEPILKTMNNTFREAGVDYDIFITKEAGDARRLAQEVAAAGVDVVAAYGGDGTVIEVASGLLGSSVPLAILPGGTGNMMSRALGIPRDITSACALAANPDAARQTISMGQINDHYFFQLVGVGAEARMVKEADREAKDRLGMLAYAVGALQALTDTGVARYRLTMDDQEPVEVEALTCLAMLSRNVGIASLAGAFGCPDTDHIDVVALQKADLTTFASLLSVVAGGNPNPDVFQHWHVQNVHIESDPPEPVQFDGEVLGNTPATVRIIPQAVQILVPPPAA